MKYVRIETGFFDSAGVAMLARDCQIAPVEAVGHLALLMSALAEQDASGDMFVQHGEDDADDHWIEGRSHWSRHHPKEPGRFGAALRRRLATPKDGDGALTFVQYARANAAPLKEMERQRKKAAKVRQGTGGASGPTT